jgi:hypothetical protein
MPRDAHIPLFLWIATAVLVHLLGGGGVDRASDYLGERLELRRFAEGVRSYLKSQDQNIEVWIESPSEPVEPPPETSPTEDPKSLVAENADDSTSEAKALPPDREQPEDKLDPEVEAKVEEKKPEEKKPDDPSEKSEAAQELVLRKRISVRQPVEDQKQPENPDAEFLGEHNNRVREQTQARVTSNDQNDPKPTPGSSAGGIADQPGNANETRVAHSEDRPGEEGQAPSDDPAAQRPQPSDVPPNAGAEHASNPEHVAKAQPGTTSGADRPPEVESPGTNAPGSKGQEATRAETGAPDLMAANGGQLQTPLPREEQAEQEGRRARKKKALPRQKLRGYEGLLGLGASGTTESGINLNLTPGLARDAIGVDQLSRERRADGARRRSQHLGSWKTAGLERWRSAIENYVPSVKPGNQTALNTARAPFAAYLALIHNRLHPIFADWYLASLDGLPGSHPLNRPDLSTNLEIILDEDEGRIVKLGVTKASGVTMFDVAALDSTQRAGPFGRPPREIVSPDGRVYLHWEFHRNPAIACTTFNARPYMLKVQPKPAPPPPPPAPDDAAEEERHGSLGSPVPGRRRAQDSSPGRF